MLNNYYIGLLSDFTNESDDNDCISINSQNPGFGNIITNDIIQFEEPHIVTKENEPRKIQPNSPFNVFYFFTPRTNKYNNIDENKKIFEINRKRKRRSDSIYKKIKSRFFKSIKIILKKNIEKINPRIPFKFLPQNFICDIKKSNNESIWNNSFAILMKDKLKSGNNNELLQYIENDIISKIRLKDLFNEYLKSEEFSLSIYLLSQEKRISQDYINEYIFKAYNFINHFTK